MIRETQTQSQTHAAESLKADTIQNINLTTLAQQGEEKLEQLAQDANIQSSDSNRHTLNQPVYKTPS